MLSPIFGDKLYLSLVYYIAFNDSRLCFCPQFLPELLFRKAITGFVCKIVSLLFVYRVDVSSVTNVCTVLFPKRIVPYWATLIFIKEKSELQRFVLGCKVLITVLFTTIMEQIG